MPTSTSAACYSPCPRQAVQAIAALLGATGTLFAKELPPDAASYFEAVTRRHGLLPGLAKVLRHIPPGQITLPELVRLFPADLFAALRTGTSRIHTVNTLPDGEVIMVPAVWALIRPRNDPMMFPMTIRSSYPGGSMTVPETTAGPQGWRVLGFGRDPQVSAAIQEGLRAQGIRARAFALTDDPDGDARLARELDEATWDGVAVGGFINGQNPDVRPTLQTTMWFNRVLNIIHGRAPDAKIILVRDPADALPAIERVLGLSPATT